MDLPREDKSELYMKALDYAKEHNLDINSPQDVYKILEEVDPEHKEDINDFMYQLKNATMFLNLASAKNEQK